MSDEPVDDDGKPFEDLRQQALRTFTVDLIDGTSEQVFAHFFDPAYGPGHLCFITVEASGIQRIHTSYNVSQWKTMKEVDDPRTGQAWRELVDDNESRVTRPERTERPRTSRWTH